jgi:hypothetical protein
LALHFFKLFFLGLPYTILFTGMTGISLHMQWPLTSQLHGSVSQREQLFFITDQTPCHIHSFLHTYLHMYTYGIHMVYAYIHVVFRKTLKAILFKTSNRIF